MSSRKISSGGSKTRARLIDAAERLMLEEGYAAVTSRRVGAEAELAPQLVHYYFASMDELFIEVFRRRADEGLERLDQALGSDRSLEMITGFDTDPPGPRFNIEFAALANHRAAVREAMGHYIELYRERQVAAIAQALDELGVDQTEHPPVAVFLMVTGLFQMMGLEATLGVTSGHQEAVEYLQRLVSRLRAQAPALSESPRPA